MEEIPPTMHLSDRPAIQLQFGISCPAKVAHAGNFRESCKVKKGTAKEGSSAAVKCWSFTLLHSAPIINDHFWWLSSHKITRKLKLTLNQDTTNEMDRW